MFNKHVLKQNAWKLNSLYFTIIAMGKLVLQHAGCSGKRLWRKMLRHCTFDVHVTVHRDMFL